MNEGILLHIMAVPPKHLRDLYELFSAIRTPAEAEQLLADILTPQELAAIAERWQIVQELQKRTPQREIAKKLNVSISKITRGSRMLQYGSGGFDLFLKKLKKG